MQTSEETKENLSKPGMEESILGIGAEEQAEKPAPKVGTLGSLLISSVVERRAIVAVLIIITLYTLYFARDLLFPIVLSLLLAGVLQPLVSQLNKIHISDGLGSAIVLAALLLVLGLGIYYASGPAMEWINQYPTIFTKVENKLGSLKESIKEATKTTEQIQKITDIATGPPTDVEVVVKGPSLGETVFQQAQYWVAMFVVILAMVYFMLAKGKDTIDNVANSISDPDQSQRLCQLLRSLQREIAMYLQTVTLINIGLGFITGVLMFFFGLPSPYLWGIIAGVMNFIPYLGAIVSTIVIGVISLLTFDNWVAIALPPLSYMLLNSIEGQFVTPWILGRRLTLNPIMVFIAILFWTWVWGVPGALLAVPSVTTLKIISNYFDSMKLLRALLS